MRPLGSFSFLSIVIFWCLLFFILMLSLFQSHLEHIPLFSSSILYFPFSLNFSSFFHSFFILTIGLVSPSLIIHSHFSLILCSTHSMFSILCYNELFSFFILTAAEFYSLFIIHSHCSDIVYFLHSPFSL